MFGPRLSLRGLNSAVLRWGDRHSYGAKSTSVMNALIEEKFNV